MWLSERKGFKKNDAISGSVTLSGDKCAVMGYSEHRGIEIYSPGGYFWRPCVGDDVLVIKDGGILGRKIENDGLLPGEVCIRSAGGAEIRLLNDGTVHIKGEIIKEE